MESISIERNTEERYEDVTSERLVDYSKKYSERKRVTVNSPRSCKKEFGARDSKVDLFGDYAETDLDQPTDYGLRYAEDDTDDDEKQNPEYFSGSVQEDTVKTYCTEGTPYETPFNFSTATSMSDLRLEDAKEDPQKKLKKELVRKEEYEHNCNEKGSSLVEKKLESLKESEKSEKFDYYQTNASDNFSRVNSLSSLGNATMQRNNVTDVPSVGPSDKLDNVSEGASVASSSNVSAARIPDETDSPSEGKSSGRLMDKEGKMVTFSRQNYYAEQTPLMFSRYSSLGSLSGFEQHSIHDDRSSIISDFRTSGAVSPSELPDSPTQTIPPSPRNHKNTDLISKIPEEAVRPSVRHLSYSKCHPSTTSVFEDDIATFKEESTPIELSTATSLSCLTIDDEIKISNTSESKESKEPEVDKDSLDKAESSSSEEKVNGKAEKEPEQVSDEGDEVVLAALISRGIQNYRYRQTFKAPTVQKPIQDEPSNILARCQRVVLNRLESSVLIPVPSDAPIKSNKPRIEITAAPDSMHVYCTEDTPANISPVGSQSNLTILSMPSVQEDVEEIEEIKSSEFEASNLSAEEEKILEECIQLGIARFRQMTSPDFVQRFDVCETPSSSPMEIENIKNHRFAEHENDVFDDNSNHSDDVLFAKKHPKRYTANYVNKVYSTRNGTMQPHKSTENDLYLYGGAPCNVRSLKTQDNRRYVVKNHIGINANFLSRIEEGRSSDESSKLSPEEEKILEECIQLGIARVRRMTSPPSHSNFFASKIEVLTHRLGTCGSPLPMENNNRNIVHRKSMYRPISEHENFMFDDNPNHSDEDAVPGECIRAAMPKVTLNISTLVGQAQNAEKSKGSSRKSSIPYRQSEYNEQSKHQSKKPVTFDDNLSFSEEEEDVIAHCVKSGMNKTLNVSSNPSLVSAKKQQEYSKTRNSANYYANKPYAARSATVQNQAPLKSSGKRSPFTKRNFLHLPFFKGSRE